MDKVKQVVDKIVHPKEHSSSTHTTGDPTHTGNHAASHAGTTAHTTGDPTHTGNHTVSHAGTTGHSTGVTGAGPHSSSIANKANPMVDSDLDGSRNMGAAQHGPGGVHNQQHSTGLTGNNHSSGLTGATATGTHGSATTGPHSSNLANKLDPHVADHDGSRNMGSAQYGSGAHNQHSTGLAGNNHGTTGSSGLTGGYGNTSTNAGPHDSNILNSADPRIDSDRDGSRNMGASQYGPGAHNQHSTGLTGNNHGTTGSGLTGNNHSSGLTGNNHGTTGSGLTGNNHSSGLTGNSHGTGMTGTNHGTHGPVGGLATGGPAPNTAGPHKSDMLNKVDPRVDSDRDGSKTVGQAPAPQY